MPHVTVFQHIDCEDPGLLGDILKAKKLDLQILKPFQGDPVPEKLGDGLIVLGGPMGVYEEKQFSWMTEELNAIRKCLAENIPVLGICLGSQMLAHAAGAQVFRGAVPEVGWYPVALTPEGRLDSLFLGLPDNFQAFHWHGDTFTLPKNSVRIAGSGFYPNQIYKIGNNSYGFQCHLEVTEAMIQTWSSLYAKELTPQGGPIRPERIQDHLASNCLALEKISEKVFSRFAAFF